MPRVQGLDMGVLEPVITVVCDACDDELQSDSEMDEAVEGFENEGWVINGVTGWATCPDCLKGVVDE